MGRLRLRRGSEPRLECAALVGLDMAETDPAQPCQVEDASRRRRDRWEQSGLSAVKEERLLGVDQKLIEGESGRPRRRDESRQTIDVIGDLAYFAGHRRFPRRR